MELINKIVYINLDTRDDRRKQMEHELERVVGSLALVQRFSATSYKGCPNTGCLLSHATVLEQAYDEGCNNVLILEDDFKFIDDVSKVHSSIKALFESKIQWDVVMLTTCAAVQEPNANNNALITKIVSSGNGAAYLVNRSMMLELSMLFKANLENLYQTKRHWEYQNDVLWKQLMPHSNWYMFNDYLGYQREGYSDLSQDIKIAIIPHKQEKQLQEEDNRNVYFEMEEPNVIRQDMTENENKRIIVPYDPVEYLTKDKIVNKVIKSFISRSDLGYNKYGTTLDRDDLSVLDWIQHAQEEHMDAILYLEKLKTYYTKSV